MYLVQLQRAFVECKSNIKYKSKFKVKATLNYNLLESQWLNLIEVSWKFGYLCHGSVPSLKVGGREGWEHKSQVDELLNTIK